jgi:hypothetical protein
MVVRLPAHAHIFSADGPGPARPSGPCLPRRTSQRWRRRRTFQRRRWEWRSECWRRTRTFERWRRSRPSECWRGGRTFERWRQCRTFERCGRWRTSQRWRRERAFQRWRPFQRCRQGDLRDLPELRPGIQLLLADDAAPVLRSDMGSSLGSSVDRGAHDHDRQRLIARATRDRRITTPLDDVSG